MNHILARAAPSSELPASTSSILARPIRLEDADVARLVENLERENPSTFETCRYLYELREGLRGAAIRVADLAAARGKSVRHIDNLIRF